MKKKKRLKIIVIIAVILVLIIVACAVFFSKAGENLATLPGITFQDADLAAVPDGTYEGSYGSFPVSAVVEVTVKDHQIIGIDLLEHNNGKGQAAEAIPGIVVAAQSLQVDAVSGATFSSKIILLAIEDALKADY